MCVVVAGRWSSDLSNLIPEEDKVVFQLIVEYTNYNYSIKEVNTSVDLFLANRTDTPVEIYLLQIGSVSAEFTTYEWRDAVQRRADGKSKESSYLDLCDIAIAYNEEWSIGQDSLLCVDDRGETESYDYLDLGDTPRPLSGMEDNRPFTLFSLGFLQPRLQGICRIKLNQDGAEYYRRFCGNSPYFTKLGAEKILAAIETEYIPEFNSRVESNNYDDLLMEFKRYYSNSATPRIYELALYADVDQNLPNLATLPFEMFQIRPKSKTRNTRLDNTFWLRTPRADRYIIRGELVSGNFALSAC